jgi:sterol 3beta-glucosyltransferase
MKITLLTYGSAGDVQPFLALAIGLRQAGHTVRLAAPRRFSDMIEAYGICCIPLAGDPEELSQLFNDAGGNVFRMVRSMQKHVLGIAADVVRGARQAVEGADLLVHSYIFTTGAHSYARQLGIPDVSVQLFPVFAPTRAFQAIGAPRRGPGWLNTFSHWLSAKMFWHIGNLGYRQVRRQAPEDFPAKVVWPFKASGERPITPLVFAISPLVLGDPPEWRKPYIHVPGYFFLDQPDYRPPEALTRFLESGDQPVCVTFGSSVNREVKRIGQTALQAVRRTGRRAIFLTGWGGWQPETLQEDALFLESAPHGWLFPRCRAVIHHGGAGTTAAGLRAGVPSIVIPHATDQPFWGSRVAAIGAGPKPVPVKKLNADNLDAALELAETEQLRRRAAEIGVLIRAEDGVKKTVTLIEGHARMFYQTR